MTLTEFKVLNDATFETQLEDVETALIFFTERRTSSLHESTNRRLAELMRIRWSFFIAYIEDSPLLCRAYDVRVIDSYCLVSRGRLLDSYLPSGGSREDVKIAVWSDDVLDNRPRKRRYMQHITSKAAGDMVTYLDEMEDEETASARRIRSVLMELDRCLQGSEEEVHRFLWSNAFLLDLFYEGGYALSKCPLGNSFVTDFVVLGYRTWTNDVGIHATLIELEKPSRKLFTKAGDPAAVLTHALRQVQDWKAWHSRNGEYFRHTVESFMTEDLAASRKIRSTRSLSGLYSEMLSSVMHERLSCSFRIIAGRRADLSLGDRIRLDEMNNSLNGITIMTYDALLEGWMRRLGSVG